MNSSPESLRKEKHIPGTSCSEPVLHSRGHCVFKRTQVRSCVAANVLSSLLTAQAPSPFPAQHFLFREAAPWGFLADDLVCDGFRASVQ